MPMTINSLKQENLYSVAVDYNEAQKLPKICVIRTVVVEGTEDHQ